MYHSLSSIYFYLNLISFKVYEYIKFLINLSNVLQIFLYKQLSNYNFGELLKIISIFLKFYFLFNKENIMLTFHPQKFNFHHISLKSVKKKQ